MKKILFVVLATCLTSLSVKAQISSFNIAEKEAFVYLGWTAGYGYYSDDIYDFAYQNTDWIEVGVHYPVWRGLNINAGISTNLNFQSIEDMGLIYSEYVTRTDDNGNTQYMESVYGSVYDEDILQIRGTVLNVGVSYTIGKGSFQFIPAFGLSIFQEWNVYRWDGPGLERYVHENTRSTRANPYLGFDFAYKNYLIGINSNFIWQENKDLVSLRIGYGFPLKNQSKMNF